MGAAAIPPVIITATANPLMYLMNCPDDAFSRTNAPDANNMG
jgi:hypothetical protein